MEIVKLFLLTVFSVSQVSSKLFDNLHVGNLPVGELPPVAENVGGRDGGLMTMDGNPIEGFMGPNHEKSVDLEDIVDQLKLDGAEDIIDLLKIEGAEENAGLELFDDIIN